MAEAEARLAARQAELASLHASKAQLQRKAEGAAMLEAAAEAEAKPVMAELQRVQHQVRESLVLGL